MRQIKKRPAQPDFLKEWKIQYRERMKQQPTYSSLSSQRNEQNYKVYLQLRGELLKEQYYICCYCCNQVDSNSSHIEHFIPQRGPKGDSTKQLDYHNIFASCNGYVGDISTIDKEFCGHKKDDWYDRDFTISPLDEECEKAFIFLANGEIRPVKDNVRAKKMIENIRLDAPALTKARAAAIDAAMVNIINEEGNYDDEKIKDEIIFYENPDEEGMMQPFCDAILFILKNI